MFHHFHSKIKSYAYNQAGETRLAAHERSQRGAKFLADYRATLNSETAMGVFFCRAAQRELLTRHRRRIRQSRRRGLK